MNSRTLMFLCSLFIAIYSAESKLSCKNEKGQDVDWEIFYKLPKEPGSANKLLKLGEAYAFLEVPEKKNVAAEWVLSDISVESSESIFGQTYLQIIQRRSKLAYIMYNDQEPNKTSSASSYGHTKGLLATDGKTGFWLVHSIPRFPLKPEERKFDFPENAKDNAQSGICISFNFKDLPKIITLFRYNKPNIYAKKTQPFVDNLPLEIKNFFTAAKPIYIRQEPFNVTIAIPSIMGTKFSAFAKNNKWGKELYDDAIAPNLEASLLVETWRNGAGTKLSADCTDKFTVYNVDTVELDFKGRTIPTKVAFPRTVDHSKWAISQQGYPAWSCIGDINRMESQKVRGGGAVCINNPAVWQAYYKIIQKFEGCPV